MSHRLQLIDTDEVLALLGNTIRSIRLSCNFSQVDFAKRSGVSYATLRKIERDGTGAMKDYVKLLRAGHALHKIEALLKEDDPDINETLENLKVKAKQKKRVSRKASF